MSLDDNWSDLYKLVCNINYVKNGWVDKKRQRVAVNPIVKLQIALVMRGDAEWQYKYRPQHIIHDELCMVLQKRAFYVSENDLQVTEISVNTYNPRNSSHVIVREIVFGPDCDPTVRGVALWFNIREDDVIMCTPQQAKRYRWKRSIKNDTNETTNNKRPSAFDSLDSFAMIRPHDKEAFDLATEMIRHRLIVTQTERISNMRVRFEALKKLEIQKIDLQKRFENLKLHWYIWAWPVNQGRERVDKQTPVPEVDGKYSIGKKKPSDGEDGTSLQLGAAVRPIWNSFIVNIVGDDRFGDVSSPGLPIKEQACLERMPWRLTVSLSYFYTFSDHQRVGSVRTCTSLQSRVSSATSNLQVPCPRTPHMRGPHTPSHQEASSPGRYDRTSP